MPIYKNFIFSPQCKNIIRVEALQSHLKFSTAHYFATWNFYYSMDVPQRLSLTRNGRGCIAYRCHKLGHLSLSRNLLWSSKDLSLELSYYASHAKCTSPRIRKRGELFYHLRGASISEISPKV